MNQGGKSVQANLRRSRRAFEDKLLRVSLTRTFLIHYNTLYLYGEKMKGERFMEARIDLHKRGYELMDSGLN